MVVLALLGVWLVIDRSPAPTGATHQAGPLATSGVPHRTTGPAGPPVTQSAATSQGPQAPATPTPTASPAFSGMAKVPSRSLVASIRPGGASGSRTAGGPVTLQVPGQWLKAASVLPVIARQPGWVEVRLAQRPNGSVAWVPAGEVALATDSYHIVIDLTTRHLQLFKDGQEVASFPAGIGVPSDPTPTGRFFVALFAEAPSPGYGPFVIVTSAHSNTISDWEESGDAITAIHGALGSDAAIGSTGAQVSHGCVRLHDADLFQLRDVPAGTPIDIVR
jgi:lipoprotein-anchoring transpeptidase ErfK/SrfK